MLIADAAPDPAAGVEFRHLHYFVAVAEERHFGRAAARLYITQPALSQAIARLESALGVQLLVRDRQNVELTAAGAELRHRARRMLADRDAAVARVRGLHRGEQGVLRLGVAQLSEAEIAPALAALAAAQPRLVLDRSGAVSEQLLSRLEDGGLDAAFVHAISRLGALDDVEWTLVVRRRLAVLMAAEHPLVARRSIALCELRDETLAVGPRELSPRAFEDIQLMCREYGGFEPRLLESPLASLLAVGSDLALIRDGTAVAVLGERTARSLEADGVRAVAIAAPPHYQLALAWRRDDRSSLLRRFVDFVLAYAREHAWIADV